MARSRVRVPRHVVAGTTRAAGAGAQLTVLVLAARGEEWFGVDLRSGAFVRVAGTEPIGLAPPGLYRAASLTIAGDGEPADPARPELVSATHEVRDLGTVRARRARRLLDGLVAPDRPAATVLGTRGPSLAYVDLDGTTPSLVLLRAKPASPELIAGEEPRLSIHFGGVTQRLPIVDQRALHAAQRGGGRSLSGKSLSAELGFRPGYLLVGLDAVRDGHVRKVVLAILARSGRGGRAATSAASPPPGPRPSPNRS